MAQKSGFYRTKMFGRCPNFFSEDVCRKLTIILCARFNNFPRTNFIDSTILYCTVVAPSYNNNIIIRLSAGEAIYPGRKLYNILSVLGK